MRDSKVLRLDRACEADPTVVISLPLSVWEHLVLTMDSIVGAGSQCLDDTRVLTLLVRRLARQGHTWSGPSFYLRKEALDAIKALKVAYEKEAREREDGRKAATED